VCFDMNRKGSNAVSKIASDWMCDNKLAYIDKVAELSNVVKWHIFTEITQPCVHMCSGLFICQLYLLPELLRGDG
jgi:hypothetical protein